MASWRFRGINNIKQIQICIKHSCKREHLSIDPNFNEARLPDQNNKQFYSKQCTTILFDSVAPILPANQNWLVFFRAIKIPNTNNNYTLSRLKSLIKLLGL